MLFRIPGYAIQNVKIAAKPCSSSFHNVIIIGAANTVDIEYSPHDLVSLNFMHYLQCIVHSLHTDGRTADSCLIVVQSQSAL